MIFSVLPVIFTALIFLGPLFCSFSQERGALIPALPLDLSREAEQRLRRPLADPAPFPWKESPRKGELPQSWDQGSWALRLGETFDTLIYQVPLTTAPGGGFPLDSLNPAAVDYLNRLKELWGLQLVLSLHGDSDVFAPASAAEEAREALALSLKAGAAALGWDGVDLEWQHPLHPGEREDYAKLMEKLRDVFFDSPLFVSVGVRRSHPQEETLYTAADKIRVLAYDGYGRHSPFETARADMEIIRSRYGLSPERLHLGIPFYGRKETGVPKDYWQDTLAYKEIYKKEKPSPETNLWEGFYYNGPALAAKKTAWIGDNQWGGFFVWSPFQDLLGRGSLLSALNSQD